MRQSSINSFFKKQWMYTYYVVKKFLNCDVKYICVTRFRFSTIWVFSPFYLFFPKLRWCSPRFCNSRTTVSTVSLLISITKSYSSKWRAAFLILQTYVFISHLLHENKSPIPSKDRTFASWSFCQFCCCCIAFICVCPAKLGFPGELRFNAAYIDQ